MAKSQAATKQVCGIDLNKLDGAAISNALEHYGIAAGKASIERRTEMLKGKLDELDKVDRARPVGTKSSFAVCDNCGGESPQTFDECPYCGVGESDAPKAAAMEPDPESGEGEEDPESEEELAALSSLGEDDPEPEVENDDTGVVEGTDIPDPDYVQQSLGVPEPEPQVLTQVRGKAVKDKKAKKNALAKVETVHEAVLVENANPAEFDKFVAEVKQIQNVANVSSYMLAKKLAEGEMSGVWKTKLNVKQKPEYGNFDAFAQVELGMSGKYVRTMLKLFARFTEEEFKTIPVTKLRLVLEVSPDAQPDVMKKIKDGASRRQIERDIGRKPGHGEQRPAGPKAKPRPLPSLDGQVTVALVAKKKRFAFWQDEAGTKPAKSITGSTWGYLPIVVNDTQVLITLMKNDSGEIVGVAEARRVDPTK